MKKCSIQLILLSVFVILLSPSCEDAAEWYLGFHKQPDFFDGEEYSKAINIFGILRPQELNEEQQSFIRVEKTVPSTEIEFSDSLLITDANVIVRYDDAENNLQALNFSLEQSESDFYPDVFKNNSIDIAEGKTYYLECSHDDYDTVYAATTVPKKPVIQSVIKNGNSIHVLVESDTSAFLFEAVYNSLYYSGYIAPEKEVTEITIDLDNAISEENELIIFVYDKNMADYFSSITSSILNLNSYRAPYSTVEGGYGCFGSLNFVKVVL